MNHPALTPALRWMANLLLLHALCARPTCRRARACRGDARECLARYAPLVPEDAREGVKALVEGRTRNIPFDELHEVAPEIDDLAEWQDRVTACAANARTVRRTATRGATGTSTPDRRNVPAGRRAEGIATTHEAPDCRRRVAGSG